MYTYTFELHLHAELSERPVKGASVHLEQIRDLLPVLTFFDQLPGMVDLLPGEFRFAPEFHGSAFRGLHSSACPFADKTAFEFSLMRCTALGRLCGAGDYAEPRPRGGLLPALKLVLTPHNIGSDGKAFCQASSARVPRSRTNRVVLDISQEHRSGLAVRAVRSRVGSRPILCGVSAHSSPRQSIISPLTLCITARSA